MKTIFLSIILILNIHSVFAQAVLDYKVKNDSNQLERSMMLDLYRASLFKEYHQEFIFVVNHFKVSGDYAWLMSDVVRKDGKQIEFENPDEMDCCHVEVLFKKSAGKWTIVESGAFSTDVWWDKIWEKYSDVSRAIFPSY